MVQVAHIIKIYGIRGGGFDQINISANGSLNIIGNHLCRSATIAVVYDNARTGRGIHVRRIVRVSPTAEIGDQYFPVARIGRIRFIVIVVVSARIIGHIGNLRLRIIVPVAAPGESHRRNKQHQKQEYLFHIVSFLFRITCIFQPPGYHRVAVGCLRRTNPEARRQEVPIGNQPPGVRFHAADAAA